MVSIAAQVKEAVEKVTTPEAFAEWFRKYFESIFTKRFARMPGEETAQFLLAQHPDWIPFFLAEAVRFLTQINDPKTFGQAVHSFIGNPISNAELKYGLSRKKAKNMVRSSKVYVQLIIKKINQFGWNSDTFYNALNFLDIRTSSYQTKTEVEKPKGFFRWFKKTVEKEVKEAVPRPKEEVLAELEALL